MTFSEIKRRVTLAASVGCDRALKFIVALGDQGESEPRAALDAHTEHAGLHRFCENLISPGFASHQYPSRRCQSIRQRRRHVPVQVAMVTAQKQHT